MDYRPAIAPVDYFYPSNGLKRPKFSVAPLRPSHPPQFHVSRPLQCWNPSGPTSSAAIRFSPRVPNLNREPIYNYNIGGQYDQSHFAPYPSDRGAFENQENYNENYGSTSTNNNVAARKRPLEQPRVRQVITNEVRQPTVVQPKIGPAPSMRVLSGGVEKVLLWSKLLSERAVLFEIIGKMDYIRNGKFSCEKIFNMRDVTSGPALQVVFYETDRPLLELEPGSLIKVVGTMKSRSRFQAFMVVKSSLEELQSSQHVFFICDRAAQELARQKITQ